MTRILALLVMSATLAACGGGDDDTPVVVVIQSPDRIPQAIGPQIIQPER